MPDWKWFAGEPKGRCAQCSEPLRRPDILVEMRGGVMHVHCAFDWLLSVVPAYYSPPGSNSTP
jgi:hypothetical protein